MWHMSNHLAVPLFLSCKRQMLNVEKESKAQADLIVVENHYKGPFFF